MKKIASLLMSGLLLFNLFGYYIIFHSEQIWMKEEMHGLIRSRSFDQDNCETITVKKDDPSLKWLEKDEFSYMGKMYDVVSKTENSGFFIIRCINDNKEEKLIAGMHHVNQIASAINSSDKSKKRAAIQFHIIKFAITRTQFIVPVFPTSKDYFNHNQKDCSLFSFSPESPPPNIA